MPAAMHKKQAIEVVEVAAQIDTAVYLGTRSRSIPVAKKRKAETGGEQLSKKAALMRGQVAVGVRTHTHTGMRALCVMVWRERERERERENGRRALQGYAFLAAIWSDILICAVLRRLAPERPGHPSIGGSLPCSVR